MRSATGTYRLSVEGCESFDSQLLHMIDRNGAIIGKFGRNGYLEGTIVGGRLDVTLRAPAQRGRLRVVFDATYVVFEGTYTPEGRLSRAVRGKRVSSKSS